MSVRWCYALVLLALANSSSCQATPAATNPQNAEYNFTLQSSTTRLVHLRHPQPFKWENPNPLMSHSGNPQLLSIGSVNPLASFAAVVPSSSFQSQQQGRQVSSSVGESIASNVLRFAINVGRELSENSYYSKSEVFSPLSVMSALTLLLAGARGKSYQQLQSILGFDGNSGYPNYGILYHQEFGALLSDIELQNIKDMRYQNNEKWRDTPAHYNIRGSSKNAQAPIQHIIKVANGIFVQNDYSLNPDYRDVATAIYRSEVTPLDFHNNREFARQHINSWVSEKTFGRIPTVINNAIPQSTNLILASVLYFKGFWENTFFEAATNLDNFFPEGQFRPPMKVQMMATGGVFPFYDAPEYDCRIIGLPYKGNLTTMYVIQPNQSSRAKLKEFQKQITPEIVDYMISKMVHRTAVMAFPKIHITRQLNMKEILQHFGLIDIFSSTESDLSLITGNQQQVNRQPLLSSSNKQWSAPVSHASITDRYNERPLIFSSRFGEIGNMTKLNATTPTPNKVCNDCKVTTTEDVEEITTTGANPELLNVRSARTKRQFINPRNPLEQLEANRSPNLSNKADLYVEDILHKVDFEVNEQGTEAAAATLTYLRRSGTDVIFRADTPFLLLVRHDPSKLILFYSVVNEPE